MANFFDCVRDRRPADIRYLEPTPKCSDLAHLGNIAYVGWSPAGLGPMAEVFPDDPQANRLPSARGPSSVMAFRKCRQLRLLLDSEAKVLRRLFYRRKEGRGLWAGCQVWQA